ncbi:DUF2304 domain-containing protein [Usitatibacter palustris]|uniref:DUF2304 domain-containing protein n=1 Tax=Usitatibacter palustris TaxID=2732487 RepID=A0A6M4HBT1_9PROT|nr:DUF2304 domain-containing protein [Usitatibacter palustris]QJR16535.1 hypothetical protein DSM104440_03370 [Usitatibacter palustris]
MSSFHIPVLFVGLVLALGILYLLRRDHLYIRQGVFWIAIALLSLVFGFAPYLIDVLGGLFGIAYPPTLLFLVAIIVLIVKALFADIALTKMRRDMRRINQRMALLESGHQDAAKSDDSKN